MSLYEDDDPKAAPAKPTSRRGGFTKVETKQSNIDLADAISTKDTDVIARSMAAALYRLGAEPLNKLAGEMLNLLRKGE